MEPVFYLHLVTLGSFTVYLQLPLQRLDLAMLIPFASSRKRMTYVDILVSTGGWYQDSVLSTNAEYPDNMRYSFFLRSEVNHFVQIIARPSQVVRPIYNDLYLF